MTLEEIQALVADFAARRDWEKFHTPKNLVMALTGEVGELNEIFQWLTPEESSAVMNDAKSRGKVEEEMADVFIYLLRLADILQLDLAAAAVEKVRLNEQRYPVELAHGRAVKHSELG